MKNIFIFQHWYYVIIILLSFIFTIGNLFLYCNTRNLLYIGINRFCECTIVNMYLLIIYYVRSMFHFGKEKEEKKWKNIKIPRFFHQKNKRGCHKKIFPETEKKNNIYHLCTLQRLYVWKYYVPEMSKPWIFRLKNSKYLCTKCEHFSVQCEL